MATNGGHEGNDTAVRETPSREATLERELQDARRDLERFAHATSHDLQEPLRIVASFLRLLEQRYANALDERGKSYVVNAVEGAARMEAMLRALVDYSRVTTRAKPFVVVDVEAALDRARAFAGKQIEASGATITHSGLEPVVADAAQLVQVFHALLDNAIKFRKGPTAHIEVTQRRQESAWVFCVADDGIGVDTQYGERIFDIYQRLHTREEFPGTGMGLALCKRIVERHGGRIWVESQSGQGASFIFTIPSREADPA